MTRFRVVVQYLLPQQWLSQLMRWLSRVHFRPWKNFLIRQIATRFKIDWSEAVGNSPDDYVHFNAFFTRELKPGARIADPDPFNFLIPSDGYISQIGPIQAGRIFQAKGIDFSVEELLSCEKSAETYRNGLFTTIYLSPRDYHRVHMPWHGTLIQTRHIPGRLFSVSPMTVKHVPRLFARNERLICTFATDFGTMTIVMVGALLVSGIETVWGGVAIPPYAGRIYKREYGHLHPTIYLQRFAEMARFNYGSTVIVLLPADVAMLKPGLVSGCPVRLGQAWARRRSE